MAITVLRGIVENLTMSEKHGAAKCRLDGHDIALPVDLISNMHDGDEVRVAGTFKKGALFAMAVKNFRLNKTACVDATNYILLMALGAFLWVLFGVFGWQYMDRGSILISYFDYFISIAGFIVMILTVRRFLLINNASSQVNYP